MTLAAALAAFAFLASAFLAPGPAWAQATVQQMGPVTAGHVAMFVGNALVVDAGGSPGIGQPPANSTLPGALPTGLGVVNSGLGFAAFSNYADGAGAYSQFLWGFDGAGNGRLKLNRVGGGGPLTLTCDINDVVAPCLTGTVTSISVTAASGLTATPNPITATGTIACATATSGAKGCVQVDGTTITASGGVISAVAGAAGINQLTGDVTAGPGTGAQAATLANSGVSAGTYTKLTVDAKGRATVGATAACADLSDDGTACRENTGTSGHTLPFLDGANSWSGTQTFAAAIGASEEVAGTTYTIAASDCGKTKIFTSGSTVTVTLAASVAPASGNACNIALWQQGAGTVNVTGSAVAAATRVSYGGFTQTAGQYAILGVSLTTISAVATANIIGQGA